VDLVLSVFAPRHPAEFARVLRPHGQLVVLAPTPEHLQELRAPLGLLEVEEGKQDRIASSLHGFVPVGEADCRYRVTLDHAAVLDLVLMGPSAFHTDGADLQAAVTELPDPVSVTVSVRISAWRRPPA
ncbi:MAG: rRNA guanine-N1-methyltransferase, partial [Friedmanniella sp.]|nr:rRNA guanine-N1-methyltransferase [Friedmanniella sp.]